MGYLKNELSEKSKYWLPKHRYLELKHFCLQYPDWRKRLNEINDISARNIVTTVSDQISNETERIALERVVLQSKISLIEHTAMETAGNLWIFLLKGVTEDGVTYVYLRNMYDIPCGRNMYYELYRRFFWLLSRSDEK